MVELKRRAFIAGCAGIGLGTAVATISPDWGDIYRLASENPSPPDTGKLVLVTLYGGNDGINTVIPFGQDAYYDARRDLSYEPGELLQLDGDYGLNPGMPGLASLYGEGRLAIVRGVGYPDQDRSHFRSMDIWQSGSTNNEVATGWIGRWLDLDDSDPVRAINVGTVLPTLAMGSLNTAATLSPKNLLESADYADLMDSLSPPASGDMGYMEVVRASYAKAASASKSFRSVFGGRGSAPESDGGVNDESLVSQLQVVSRCIKAGLSTKVYCVSLGGFDTHSNEKARHQGLLNTVDRALTQFLADISTSKHGRDVVVVAYSEFGRRVAANASDGTDHGTSGPVFIAGPNVTGGFYGDDPSLSDLANDDLKTTTDFRDIYAELSSKVLSTDPSSILGSNRPTVGFLA